MAAVTKLTGTIVARLAMSSFLGAINPIVNRVWVILFLLHNFRTLVSKDMSDSMSTALISLYPLFLGVIGFVILIPLIIVGNKVFRRKILKGVNSKLRWKYSLLLQLFDFLWTHLICISILFTFLTKIGFHITGLYLFVIIFCFFLTKLFTWYRGTTSKLLTNLFFQNVGFGIYLLSLSIYVVFVESFHLTLIEIFLIIMIPRLMLSSSSKTSSMYLNNNGFSAIRKRFQEHHLSP